MRAGYTFFELLVAIVVASVAAYFFPGLLTVYRWVLLIGMTLFFGIAILGVIFQAPARLRRRQLLERRRKAQEDRRNKKALLG